MTLSNIIGLLGTFFYIAIFARVILSWLPTLQRSNPLVQLVFLVTEPILAPIRKVVPTFGMMDLSPMIAMIVILIVQNVLQAVLA